MSLQKIIEVKNDGGKNAALFNAFLRLNVLEEQSNLILRDSEYLVGTYADYWLVSKCELSLYVADVIVQLAITSYKNNNELYSFEYNKGYCIFMASNEEALLEKFKTIQTNLYASFGKRYFDSEAPGMLRACGAV